MWCRRVCVYACVCVCVYVAASFGVSSCAGPGGRIGKRPWSRPHTGRVWRPCASGSDASARRNVRSASRSCPMCTCMASHLHGDKRKKNYNPRWAQCELIQGFLTWHRRQCRALIKRHWRNWLLLKLTLTIPHKTRDSHTHTHTVGWRNWENRLFRKIQLSITINTQTFITKRSTRFPRIAADGDKN